MDSWRERSFSSESWEAFAQPQASRQKSRDVRQQLDEHMRCGRYVPRYYLAWMSLTTGEIDAAFEGLVQGVEERELQLTLVLKNEPVLDRLRTDPRYHALLRKMNLE